MSLWGVSLTSSCHIEEAMMPSKGVESKRQREFDLNPGTGFCLYFHLDWMQLPHGKCSITRSLWEKRKHFIVSVYTSNPTQLWRTSMNTRSRESVMDCWSPNTIQLWTFSSYSPDFPETPGVQVKDKMERERSRIITTQPEHLLSTRHHTRYCLQGTLFW